MNNCNFSVSLIIYWPSLTCKKPFPFFQLPEMLWNWNIHWDYALTNEVDLSCHQLDYLFLSQNLFWSINYTLVTWYKCIHLVTSISVLFHGANFNFILHVESENGSSSTNDVCKKSSTYKVYLLCTLFLRNGEVIIFIQISRLHILNNL